MSAEGSTPQSDLAIPFRLRGTADTCSKAEICSHARNQTRGRPSAIAKLNEFGFNSDSSSTRAYT